MTDFEFGDKDMQRLQLLKTWLATDVGIASFQIEPASSDASFRRYFRVRPDTADGDSSESLIVMDAPPTHEDTGPFLKIARMLLDYGVNVPVIKHIDVERGFLLLSDLGSIQYLERLNTENVDQLYADAMDSLFKLQLHGPRQPGELPPYDHALLMREMELFREWYLQKHLGLSLTPDQHEMLDHTFELLAESALEQPLVCVHRDYHSRNLMITSDNNPGVLDFQDAVIGPVTYDLVSLLRDCYIAWPRERVETWALNYLGRAREANIIKESDQQRLLRWFDLMGVQRHLKASGIFARLNYRDGKPGYLKDIPRTLSYVADVSKRYAELQTFNEYLQSYVPDISTAHPKVNPES